MCAASDIFTSSTSMAFTTLTPEEVHEQLSSQVALVRVWPPLLGADRAADFLGVRHDDMYKVMRWGTIGFSPKPWIEIHVEQSESGCLIRTRMHAGATAFLVWRFMPVFMVAGSIALVLSQLFVEGPRTNWSCQTVVMTALISICCIGLTSLCILHAS